MISDLIYRCPACQSFKWFQEDRCIHCHASIDVHSRSHISVNNKKETIAYWYDRILSFDFPENDNGEILKSGKVGFAKEAESGLYKGFEGMTAVFYVREKIDEGQLTLFKDRLKFSGPENKTTISIDSIASVTIESNTVIVVSRQQGPLFFDFLEESGKKWEDCIKKAVSDFCAPEKILEYFPRIRFAGKSWQRAVPSEGCARYKVPERKWYAKDYSTFFKVVRHIARFVVNLIFKVRITGAENIPKTGSAIMLANHLSFLDAIILGMFFPRNIWFMSKSSQLYHWFLFWFLRIAGAFPVRRYTVDVAAARNVIRLVNAGHIVGIFPEGERSWDGRMLPFKTGLIRMILALDQPIIPVGISGAYELMPRWTTKIKKVPVHVNIGAPIKFPHIPGTEQTEEKILETCDQLKAHILGLMDDSDYCN